MDDYLSLTQEEDWKAQVTVEVGGVIPKTVGFREPEHIQCLDLKPTNPINPQVLANSPSKQAFRRVFYIRGTQTAQEKGQNVLTSGVPQSGHPIVKLESTTQNLHHLFILPTLKNEMINKDCQVSKQSLILLSLECQERIQLDVWVLSYIFTQSLSVVILTTPLPFVLCPILSLKKKKK